MNFEGFRIIEAAGAAEISKDGEWFQKNVEGFRRAEEAGAAKISKDFE